MKLPWQVMAAVLVVPGVAQAAGPEGSAPAKGGAVKVEAVPGKNVKRVTLSPKAAERLGIQTALVAEEEVSRRQMVSGLVVAAPKEVPAAQRAASAGLSGFTRAATFAPVPATKAAALPEGAVLVAVSLSPGEWSRLDKSKPARLLPLQTRSAPKEAILAQPAGLEPVEDGKRAMLTVHYAVKTLEEGLSPGRRLRVELPIAGGEAKRSFVPYGAVYYDAHGGAWVYVNSEPFVFERHPVTVERVSGAQAVLSEGPRVGTGVVTVGAALLYGCEIFGK